MKTHGINNQYILYTWGRKNDFDRLDSRKKRKKREYDIIGI